jgi:hypothetical protein
MATSDPGAAPQPGNTQDPIPDWITPAAQAAEDAGRPAWDPAPRNGSGGRICQFRRRLAVTLYHLAMRIEP